MSEHYGPFEEYTEVMASVGVFGIKAGQTLEVQEDGSVVIEDVEVVEEEAENDEIEKSDEILPGVKAEEVPVTGDNPNTPEQPGEAVIDPPEPEIGKATGETVKTDPELPVEPDAAAAFAEAQKTPSE